MSRNPSWRVHAARAGFWLLILACLPWAARADVYKFIARNGQVIYTDTPRHKGYKLVIKTPARENGPVVISLGSGRRLSDPPPSAPLPRAPLAFAPQRPGANGALALRRSQYAELVERAAYRHGLDPGLLHAVIQAESAYNPGAVSHKGAMGLMQLMPGTAARYGVRDPYDPEQNILGGARYLRDLLGLFGANVRLAVAAYNAGEHNVMKYGYQVPPFAETQDYVARVLGLYSRYN